MLDGTCLKSKPFKQPPPPPNGDFEYYFHAGVGEGRCLSGFHSPALSSSNPHKFLGVCVLGAYI